MKKCDEGTKGRAGVAQMMATYPINAMRNMATLLARTDLVLSLDLDFVVSREFNDFALKPDRCLEKHDPGQGQGLYDVAQWHVRTLLKGSVTLLPGLLPASLHASLGFIRVQMTSPGTLMTEAWCSGHEQGMSEGLGNSLRPNHAGA